MPRMTITTPLSFQNMPARKMTDGINPILPDCQKDPGPFRLFCASGCPLPALFLRTCSEIKGGCLDTPPGIGSFGRNVFAHLTKRPLANID